MRAETAISSAVTRAIKSSVNSFMAKALPDGDVGLHRNGEVSFAANQQMSQAAKGCMKDVFHDSMVFFLAISVTPNHP